MKLTQTKKNIQSTKINCYYCIQRCDTAERGMMKPAGSADGEVTVVVADEHRVTAVERQRTNFRHLHTTNRSTGFFNADCFILHAEFAFSKPI